MQQQPDECLGDRGGHDPSDTRHAPILPPQIGRRRHQRCVFLACSVPVAGPALAGARLAMLMPAPAFLGPSDFPRISACELRRRGAGRGRRNAEDRA